MKNLYGLFKGTSLALFCLVAFSANAQTPTWEHVHHILTTKCAGSGCHSGSQPGWNVNDSKGDLWADLIYTDVTNPSAAASKYKTVLPGHPYKSFLLKKVAHGLGSFQTSDLELKQAEGANMPDGRPALSKVEVEIIRQWILAGADTSSAYAIADTSRISTYYNMGGVPTIQQPAPPAEGEGFQVHLGPIFFDGGDEVEYFKTHELFLDEDIEVTGLDLTMNDESHHFILRKFTDGKHLDPKFHPYLYLLDFLSAFDADKDYVMAWQNDEEFLLPDKTAYFWDTTTRLDLNFHMFNYNSDILPGDVYLNVYTQPKGTAEKEMKSDLINSTEIGIGSTPISGNIKPNRVSTFTDIHPQDDVSIWTLTSHTHSRGSDFNIYLRKADGSRGPAVYEGKYDYSAGFNTGSYDWEHPPTRFWDCFNTELYDANDAGNKLYDGFIYEVEYTNNTPDTTFGFGFTTNDEMMIYYVQYVDGKYEPTSCKVGVEEINDAANTVSMYPNPTTGTSNIEYTLKQNEKVSIEVYNLIGKQVKSIVKNEDQPAGNYQVSFNANELGAKGIYLVKMAIGDQTYTDKLIVQ